MATSDIPDRFLQGPFRLEDAQAASLTRQVLRGRRFRRLHRGVYVCAHVELTLQVRLRAALLVLPADAAAAGVSALQHYGVDVGPALPLHVVTRHRVHRRIAGVVCHRRIHRMTVRRWSGVPTCAPEQAWVQACLHLGFVDRVIAGDWLLHHQRTSLTKLQQYVDSSHEHGVKRARRGLAYVRERVESPRETRLRLMLVFARLPEPEPNLRLGDEHDFIARCDLVYLPYLLIVEYDGDQHRLDRRQRERDIWRREALERDGWRMVVVTAAGMRDAQEVVRRVHLALVERGYRGPGPVLSDVWQHWFASA